MTNFIILKTLKIISRYKYFITFLCPGLLIHLLIIFILLYQNFDSFISSFNNYLIQMFQNGDLASHMPFLETCANQVQPPFTILLSPSRKTFKYTRQGHWNQKQRLKYVTFLIYFQKLMEDPIRKKNIKIYDMMSDMVVTRNSNQCRNHHQKMEKYRSSISEIITTVSGKYQPRVFTQITARYSILVKTLLYNQEKYIRDSTQEAQTSKQSKKHEEVCQNLSQINSKDEKTIENMIHCQRRFGQNCSQLLKNVGTGKQDLMKTKAQYNESLQPYEEVITEEIPCMRISQENSQDDSQFYSNTQNNFNLSKISTKDLFENSNGLKLTKIGRIFYRTQARKMDLQRQWHAMNIQHLSCQLIKEKQSIKYCESAIKLLQLAIDIINDG